MVDGIGNQCIRNQHCHLNTNGFLNHLVSIYYPLKSVINGNPFLQNCIDFCIFVKLDIYLLHFHNKMNGEIDIRYEKYGSDHRRSLINQLVSSICWNILVSNLTCVPLEIFLTLYGPLMDRFCSFYMIFKYSSFFHEALLLSFITVVKYLCIFVLKNPTGDN